MSRYIIDCKNNFIEKIENIDTSITELKILSILGCGEFIDANDIAEFINVDNISSVRMHIHRLRQKGFNIETMHGTNSKYKLYEEVYFK